MEALQLLSTRRSVLVGKLHTPGPSSHELRQILEAGVRVPDHGKIGPWRIQVVTKDGQKELGNLAATLFEKQHGDRANEKMIEFERMRPQRAPVLLVVTSNISIPHKIPEIEQRLSGGALCMNILNAAHALGFSAQWVTEWLAYDEDIKTTLGHESSVDIIGMIYIGSATEPPQQRDRPALEQVVSEWSG